MKKFAPQDFVGLGINIGGTKSSVALGTGGGRIIEQISFPTREKKGPQQTIDRLIAAAESLMHKHERRPRAIGIACGSPLDPHLGVIQSPPNLPSWKNVPIVDLFSQRFSLDTYLENDANAGAIAEHQFGAGRGVQNMVFLTFGTGLGGGLILNGAIYRGANCYAGEFGHWRMTKRGPLGYHKHGSFEGYCSGGGIAQLAATMRRNFRGKTLLGLEATAADVGSAAKKGDKLALAIFEKCGEHLGLGLSWIVDGFNPERIVIGSIFVRCEKFIRPGMERVLQKESLAPALQVCRIVPAALGERVGELAALSVAWSEWNARNGRKVTRS